MSEDPKSKDKKETPMSTERTGSTSARNFSATGNAPKANRLRSIHPLGMRVVVQLRREANMTDTGLYLPEGAKEAKQDSMLGEVLEVASAIDRDTKEEANISGVPEGALVLIAKSAGVGVPWDDDLRIVDTKDILAIIQEVELN